MQLDGEAYADFASVEIAGAKMFMERSAVPLLESISGAILRFWLGAH